MRARPLLTIFALLAAVAGCGEKENLTIADSDNLGKDIVEALAKAAGEEPPPGWLRGFARPHVPLNLSEVAIVDAWESFTDPGVAERVADYARGQFPGTLLDCDPSMVDRTGRNCFPLSREDGTYWTATGQALPRDGMLILGFGSPDFPGLVLAAHYYPVERDGVLSGIHDAIYGVELERLKGGGWKVGEGRHVCCT